MKAAVRKYHEESEREDSEKLSMIMEMLGSFYGQENMSFDICKKFEDKNLESICFFALLLDAPAYTVKVIAEIYGADFWVLWEQIRDVARRKLFLYKQEV